MEMVATIGLLLLTIVTSATLEEHRVVRRFAGGDFYWNAQAANAAPQTAAPWPPSPKGDAAAAEVSGGDARWSPVDIQQKQEDDIAWNTRPQGNDKGGEPEEETGGDLQVLLRGVPGTDFPDFVSVPDTAFDCSLHPHGYYADTEAGCQVFHICQHPGNRKDSFLCPLGTIFNQRHLVCDWWFNVNCSESESLYARNSDIFGEVTTTTTTTTEKPQMPWSAQDLDRKRPPTAAKGWPMGKKNNAPPRKDVVATKRGAKSDTSLTAVNAWTRSDVQKEVTLSWTTSGGYGSPSAASSSKASSWNAVEDHRKGDALLPTKPVWFGIDGQPAKDQSDAVRKRTGLTAHTPTASSFGHRLKSSSPVATSTSFFQPTTSPRRVHSVPTTTTRQQNWASTFPDPTGNRFSSDTTGGIANVRFPNPTGRFSSESTASIANGGFSNPTAARHSDPTGRFSSDSTDGFSNPTAARQSDPTGRFSDSTGSISTGGFPDTSIVPTGVSGVWEQDTARSRGIVTKSESFVHRQRGSWGERSQVGDSISASASSARQSWRKFQGAERLSTRKKKKKHPNSIRRQKDRS